MTFYSGGIGERLGNYCLLYRGDKNGKLEKLPVAVAYNGENYRKGYSQRRIIGCGKPFEDRIE